jgi:hypothetical protein
LAIATISIALLGIEACSKKSSGPPAPVLIGGYASSDSVASANLVAYWPFDGNVNDVKGGLSGSASGVTYATGIRGQAYQGASGSYATAVPGSSLAGLTSFSLSVWYQLPTQPASGDPGGMFFMGSSTNPNEIILETEHYSPVSGDSVKIHHGFDNVGSAGWQGFTLESYDTVAIGKWVHLVMTYDGGSSTYTFYQNAIPTGVSSAFSNGGYITPTTILDGPPPVGSGTPATTTMGSLNLSSDPPTSIVIGTWPVGLYGVSPTSLGGNGSYVGQMDELRIFNKALTQLEVSGLFLNGQAGR